MEEIINGEKISLRPSTMKDRRLIYDWLANSNVTHLMLGPPDFPDSPIPTWNEFINDYYEYYFDGSQPQLGRCFIIYLDKEPIGQINYNEIYPGDHSTELDIWLSDSIYMNKGYGTDALKTLCNYLIRTFACEKFFIAPSKRNIGAVKSYQKAGFEPTEEIPVHFIPDYDDAIVMIKQVNVISKI